ncbi:hypothetical protein GRI34_00040 [Erythrobacter aquimaris]|uniref:Uncharacterized protein n=1 Tax=Qipengyuania aquimaris TaxID=255984 RepID=A0A6I4TFZ0_9SPHN|nr:hypothetical protein [Qipengyuania aquimaris]MXO94804.1 hypothetical protein [Qipengyuania aquimaris]
MDRNTSLMREVRAVLRSPSFQRSPSLSKMLEYLLSREISADGKCTQYDIAVEALGKDESFNELTDSAVRVQMSRLRKALRDYYLTRQPEDGLYLHIRTGDYRLRTANLETAYPKLATAKSTRQNNEPTSSKSPDFERAQSQLHGADEIKAINNVNFASQPINSDIKKRFASSNWLQAPKKWQAALIVAAVVGAAALGPLRPNNEAAATTNLQHGLEVPLVALMVEKDNFGGDPAQSGRLLAKVRNDLNSLLRKSMVSRASDDAEGGSADFTIKVQIEGDSSGQLGAHLVLSDRENRVITERTVRPTSKSAELVESLFDEVTSIVSPAGHITRALARGVVDAPKNDFECFISVEGARASGSVTPVILDKCVTKFPDGEFTPYLKIRQAFSLAQQTSIAGKDFSSSSAAWRMTSDVLASHPENPYANTLAAKLLVARKNCEDAILFGREGFSRGRTYPALELAVILDAFECPATLKYRQLWTDRIARITQANPEPHTLLESYILIGLLISGQEELIDYQRTPAFELDIDHSLAELNRALRSAVHGEATEDDVQLIRSMLPALLFSDSAQRVVLKRINLRN